MNNKISKSVAIIISPNWKDYAEKYLQDCIDSIRKQDYQGKMKIFLTDNETSERSFQLISRIVPEAEFILNKENDGFAKGNNDAMRLATAENFDYLFLINMDAVAESDCIRKLVDTAENDKNIGAVQPRIMLWDEKEKINSLGNVTHFLGFGYSQGYKDKYSAGEKKVSDIGYFSGAAVMLKSEALKKIGLFDEEYWMYNEDQELGLRLWLSGYRCVISEAAAAEHKYEFSKSIKQFYWMDRNRILVILECYSSLTLLLIFPAFIVMEIGLILFSLKSGWFKEKLQVWKYFVSLKNWKYILKARKRNQDLRKIKESEFIRLIVGRIWYQEVDDWKLRLINPIFNGYWDVCRRVIGMLGY
jgi:N-acetylglucosaminyl-diphospho-decaprenol L-rhamnosyltransferase